MYGQVTGTWWCVLRGQILYIYDCKCDAECMIHNDRTQKISTQGDKEDQCRCLRWALGDQGICISNQQSTSGAEVRDNKKNKGFGLCLQTTVKRWRVPLVTIEKRVDVRSFEHKRSRQRRCLAGEDLRLLHHFNHASDGICAYLGSTITFQRSATK